MSRAQTCNQVIACDVVTEERTKSFGAGGVQLPLEFWKVFSEENLMGFPVCLQDHYWNLMQRQFINPKILYKYNTLL